MRDPLPALRVGISSQPVSEFEMKVIACIVLALSAAVVAGEGFYPDSTHSAPSAYSNYNHYDYQTAPEDGVWRRLFGSNRRQGLLGGLGGLVGPGVLIGVLLAIILTAAGLGYMMANINSSGRGLDTDDWEVNHSVWLDQLQRDFEASWSTD
ncbi:uncharacterized protein LOC119100974 [Pollicipes pollicipes]|uniref:uncharacterized protein LOC119100974 n=1 Tax=Pollicipes pollicipes TaxID=41117 RepID=UPI001884D7EE|nr:uncharacterized protein LOC119100974 [Pollicipes pollicipes]